MARQETVVVVEPALLARQVRIDPAIEPPQRPPQVALALGLGTRFLLLALQAQHRRRHPPQPAADQAGDDQEDDHPAAGAPQPASHALPSRTGSSTGTRSGEAM